MTRERPPVDLAPVLSSWLTRLGRAHVRGEDPGAASAQLSGWLALLHAGSEGDAGAHAELLRLVAFDARNHGAEGRPASVPLTRLLLLEDALLDVLGPHHGFAHLTRALLQAAVDAHGVGLADRLRQRHERELIQSTPLVRLGDRAVLGFLLGPMVADNLDALFGRLLRVCVGAGAPLAIIDLAHAAPDDDLFHRTIKGFAESPDAPSVRLILTGLRDPETTRAALSALGCPLGRITLEPALDPVLEALLGAHSSA